MDIVYSQEKIAASTKAAVTLCFPLLLNYDIQNTPQVSLPQDSKVYNPLSSLFDISGIPCDKIEKSLCITHLFYQNLCAFRLLHISQRQGIVENAIQHFSRLKLQGAIKLLFRHVMFLNKLAAHSSMIRKVVYDIQHRIKQIMNSVQEQLLYWLSPNTI